jgi:hypothetical protein
MPVALRLVGMGTCEPVRKLQGSLQLSLEASAPLPKTPVPKQVPVPYRQGLPRGPQPVLVDLFCAIVKLFLIVWTFEDISPVQPN